MVSMRLACKGALLAILAVGPSLCDAQYLGWEANQVNTSLCGWTGLSGAVVRDTVYLAGGSVWWQAGLRSGAYVSPVADVDVRRHIWTYNFSNAYDTKSNTTQLLLQNAFSSAGDRSFAANYDHGSMLSNDYGFSLFGGAWTTGISQNTYGSPPDAQTYTTYNIYPQNGQSSNVFNQGFSPSTLPSNISHYVADGATVSVPWENKAWYISGVIAAGHKAIETSGDEPSIASKDLLSVDLSDQFSPDWSNHSLDSHVSGRAGAEAVWVPVGDQGILVMLGGVVYPEWWSSTGVSANSAQSKKSSPGFMRDIDVYDISSKKWYQQSTTEGPGQLTKGCAVAATAQDQSSYNVYYYGGYDGLAYNSTVVDDVWVLSMPSFTWTLLTAGTTSHSRKEHKCFMPYPDQMMVFAGVPNNFSAAGGGHCLANGPVLNYNLSTGEWLDSYSPNVYANSYSVPTKVASAIGGGATGGATKSKPDGGWDDDALGSIFDKQYSMGGVKRWYPYTLNTTSSNKPPTSGENSNDDQSSSGLPTWAAAVIGVILGLVVLTAAVVIFILWRRRKFIFKHRSGEESSEAGSRIVSWLKGQPRHARSEKTINELPSEKDGPATFSGDDSAIPSYHSQQQMAMEMPDNHAPAELADTSMLPELSTPGSEPDGPFRGASPFSTDSISRGGDTQSWYISDDAGGFVHTSGRPPASVTPTSPTSAYSDEQPMNMETVAARTAVPRPDSAILAATSPTDSDSNTRSPASTTAPFRLASTKKTSTLAHVPEQDTHDDEAPVGEGTTSSTLERPALRTSAMTMDPSRASLVSPETEGGGRESGFGVDDIVSPIARRSGGNKPPDEA